VLDVLGGKAVKGLILRSQDGIRQTRRLDCDLVCMSGGWSPAVHLTSHGGIPPSYREHIAAFVPGGYAAGQFGAGALTGAFTLQAATSEGIDAGRSAAYFGGHDFRAGTQPPALQIPAALAAEAYGIEPV